jgi:hypothetical protein
MTFRGFGASLRCIMEWRPGGARDWGHADPVATGIQITYNESSPTGESQWPPRDPAKPVKM